MQIPSDPSLIPLDIYPTEVLSYVQNDTCMRLFTVALTSKDLELMCKNSTEDKLNRIHPHNGVLCSPKKNEDNSLI